MRGGVVRVVAACAAMGCASASFAGELSPQGPPGPTMKTLNEVEARIPVGPMTTPGDTDSVYRITQPGSYFLTGDVNGQPGKHGITIASDEVTLDLNGFTVRGITGARSGVHMDAYHLAVAVRNGVVSDWHGVGVMLRSSAGVISDIRIFNCEEWGINTDFSFAPTVERCTVFSAGQTPSLAGGGIRVGFPGVVRECNVRNVQGIGILAISSMVIDCYVDSVFADTGAMQPGQGIHAEQVDRCAVRFTASTGITVSKLARGCTVAFATGVPYSGPNLIECY